MGSYGKGRTRQGDCGGQVLPVELTLLYLVVHGDCQCPMGGLQITLPEVPQAIPKSTM